MAAMKTRLQQGAVTKIGPDSWNIHDILVDIYSVLIKIWRRWRSSSPKTFCEVGCVWDSADKKEVST